MYYTSLAIDDPIELTFGIAPKPLTTRSGMIIGGGTVYPELNFTLPPITIDAKGMAQPLPRPFAKSDHSAIESVEIAVR